MEGKWRRSAWAAGAWRPWLSDHGSLTRRLQARCTAFRVNRLAQSQQQPCRDESASLDLRPGRLAWVREVLLMDGETPLVFAHSVMSLHGLRGPWAALTGLGNRPLGAALFADPRVQRHPLEARRLDQRHPLYRRACRHLAQAPRHLWARRSRFMLAGHALLVTEVFLPEILNLP